MSLRIQKCWVLFSLSQTWHKLRSSYLWRSCCLQRMMRIVHILDPTMFPQLLCLCVLSSRWALSVNLPLESAISSSSSLHHTEHLCKHRATAAKHRCWRTVHTPPPREQCATIRLPEPSFLYSPPQKEKWINSFHLQNFLSRERISKRETF